MTGIIGESNKDRRLPKKELVIGMTVSGNAKAYPFSAISQETVIDDHFTGEEVVITFDPTSESGAAFVWWLKGRVLSFEPSAGRAGVALRCVADEKSQVFGVFKIDHQKKLS